MRGTWHAVVGIFVGALGVAITVVYSVGASLEKDNRSEAHTLFHWGAGISAFAGSLLVMVFLFWPAYWWLAGRVATWVATQPVPPLRPPWPRNPRRFRVPFRSLERPQLDTSEPPAPPAVEGLGRVIVTARYGAENSWSDVTALIRTFVNQGNTRFLVQNDSMGGDPLPNAPKRLEVHYEVNGVRNETTTPEGSVCVLNL